MAFIQIENVGEVGVINDMPDYSLPPEAWSNASNVRFSDGKVSKMQGEEAVYGTPPISPHFLLSWQLPMGYRWIYADANDIYYVSNGVHTYATRYTTSPGDDDYTAGSRPLWTGGILHGVPILNHNNISDAPQQWDNTNGRFKDLDNWPVDTYCQVMRPFKNFLIALDITKSANRYPYLVKWGHPADAGTVPTSWDETDATKLAGEFPISQSGGFLVDCLPFQGSNVLYKTDAIWSMTPTGGLDVFRFSPVIQTVGMLTARCGAVFQGQHFIVGNDDIYLFNGSRPQSLVNRRVRKWFFQNLDNTHFDKTIVIPNFANQEIWICFVEAGASSGYLTKALVWKWTNNTWTIKDLPDTAFLAHGHVAETADIFDGSSGTFNTDFGAFGAIRISPAEAQLLHAKVYGTAALLQGDNTYQTQGTDYESYVERTGLGVAGVGRDGQLKVDPTKRKFLRAIYPKVVSPVGVTLKVQAGAQEYPDGPITWAPAQDFNSLTDTRVGFAVNGKYLAVKFSDGGSAVPWELSGYALDIDIIGNI